MQKGEHMLPFTLSGTFMFGQDIFGQDIVGQDQAEATSPGRSRRKKTGATTSTMMKKMPPPRGSNSRPESVIRAATVMPRPSAA